MPGRMRGNKRDGKQNWREREMKRGREIDLEAPVREDDDGDDADGGETCTSTWGERSFTKKARWMSARLSEASRRDPRAGTWPRELTSPRRTDAESNQHLGLTESQALHPGIKEIYIDERAMPAANPKPSAGFNLQFPRGPDFEEARPQAKQNLSQFDNCGHMKESKLNSTDKEKACKEKLKGGEEVEQIASKKHLVQGKKNNRRFSSPPAVLLYSVNDRQDIELHSALEKQGALLSRAEVGVRLEAISCISQWVELIQDRSTRKLVTQIIEHQLWKEEELAVIQALVKILCSVGLISCADDPEDKGLDRAPSQVVAHVLLKYITTKNLRNSPLKSGLKVQILRSLYLLGKAGASLELDLFGPLAKEQLGSSNPRLREWGIRLLVQSIKERYGRESRDLNEIRTVVSDSVQRSRAEGESLMHALLEYTRDPYPNVREAVVWGILKLHGKGFALKHSTYKLAVALLRDSFESVRICAIKLVGICIKAAPWDGIEGLQSKYIDNAYLQICNMMTDMVMTVRQEACNILAEMTGVSDSVLLQSLCKKVLTTSITEKESSAGGSMSTCDAVLDAVNLEENKLLDWSAAGAFVVGLEDEFWEVRSAAIKALAKLGMSSEKMAHGALELMVDMINDDSSQVRQLTIQALANLARAGCLSVLEAHLHMFIGILEDSNMEMRKSGHYLLSVISLPNVPTFQLTIRAILASLEKHPEDEASLLVTLENLGKLHASHTECIANELVQELKGLLNGDSGLDDPRCVAVLVLLLGAATSNGKIISLIPSQIISVASLVSNKLPISLPLLQVLPMGFKTVQYAWSVKNGSLSHETNNKDQFKDSDRKSWPLDGSKQIREYLNIESRAEDYIWQGFSTRDDLSYARNTPLSAESDGNHGSAGPSSTLVEGRKQSWLHQCWEQEILRTAGEIVASALGTSLFLEIKAFKEVLQRLSGCRKELKALKGRCLSLSGTVSFYGMYLQCLILVVQLRANFVSQESCVIVKKPGLPQDLLNKLDSLVKHLLHRFLGFRFEQLLQVFELHALVCVWNLALHPIDLVNAGSHSMPFLELGSTVTTAEKITKSEDLPPSLLLTSIQKQLLNEEGKANSLNIWRIARQLAVSYWPSQMSVDSSVMEMWADMKAPGSDFDHPLGFIAGLPLGIPIDVTVFNVPDTFSLWVQFRRDTSAAGYKLLDVEESGINATGNIRHLSTLLQLDEMPQVSSSMCRLCIVLEGVDHHQGLHVKEERVRGPKGSIVPLCIEIEVHLFLIKERSSKQLPQGKR